ncbi:MAG: epoxyqueuosine reductase QueH [Patescibacteria group bacterium]|jgi:predicted adenine nucleotide alpha hydrolase (AANH) superfamily ATPase/VanZ family protein|nr:epoxyqueuosine reductase QueH [Patescibacteria group bacterium]
MKKKSSKLLYTFLWGLLILILLTFPMKEFETHEITYYDKGVHFILFGIFAYLIFQYLLIDKNKEFLSALKYAFLFSSLYSFSLEIVQAYVPGRTVDEYDLLFGIAGAALAMLYAYFINNSPKPSLLLHICCIGCGVYVSEVLRKEFRVSLYFYNPNIFPLREYEKRLEEIKKVAKMYKIKVIIGGYDHKKWREMVSGHETDPEKGERCMMCYRERLEETARYASENGFHYFATTLTTSPHKNAQAIMKFGQDLGRKYELGFLERDFKKQDGFKKAAEMSRKLDLYRQDYCGCEFSLADAEKRRGM